MFKLNESEHERRNFLWYLQLVLCFFSSPIHTSVCVCTSIKLPTMHLWAASNAKTNGFYTYSLHLMQHPHWHNVIILTQTYTQMQTLNGPSLSLSLSLGMDRWNTWLIWWIQCNGIPTLSIKHQWWWQRQCQR